MDKGSQGRSVESITRNDNRVVTSRNEAPVATIRRRLSRKWLIIAAAVVVVIVAGGAACMYVGNQVDSSKYQAVFLSNGQVYFGKLHDYYIGRPYLTNVYYIQSPTSSSSNSGSAQADTSQQLVKLGSEVHAPENEMILNKSSIVFVENLTDKSKVVQLMNGK